MPHFGQSLPRSIQLRDTSDRNRPPPHLLSSAHRREPSKEVHSTRLLPRLMVLLPVPAQTSCGNGRSRNRRLPSCADDNAVASLTVMPQIGSIAMSFPLRTYRRYPSGGTAHYYITLPTVSVGSLFLTYTGLIGLGCEGVRAGTLDMLELDLDFGAARGKTRYEVSRSIMPNHTRSPLGMWTAGTGNDAGIYRDPGEALPWLDRPLYVIEKESSIAYATGGEARMGITGSFPDHAPIIAFAPPCLPDRLGDPDFLNDL